MSRFVRKSTAAIYKHAVKPLLFRRHPDKVHTDIIQLGKLLPRVPGLRSAPKLWSYQHDALRQQVFGMTFRGPVGLAAGFDKNIEVAHLLRSVGFGFMTGGSVTAEQCDGNPHPWFHRLPRDKSLVVFAGLPNHGVTTIARTIEGYSRHVFSGMPLIVSIAKTNNKEAADDEGAIADYCKSFATLEQTPHVDMYELNISCPNTYGGEPFTTPERLGKLLHAIDELKLQRPVTIKMPIHLGWEHTRSLLDVIVRHRVAGVTIGNLMKDRRQVTLREALPDTVKGSLSGVPTRDISTGLIRKTYQRYGDKLVIIGVGGIFSAEDAYAKIRAGATLVGLVTGMIFEGPQLIGDISHDLVKLLKRDGFGHISQAIGADTTHAD